MNTEATKNNEIDKILYKEISFKIVGCLYEVFNELGPAHKEYVYHEALSFLFRERNMSCKSKNRIPIKFKNCPVGIYEPDFIIEDKIILEIKSVLAMPKVFEKQLYYYLRGTIYKLGYLVNFGSEKIEIKRRVYDEAREKICGYSR